MALNPNHRVVEAARGQWHKIAALIMVKLGITELEVTMTDVLKILNNVNIVLDARGEKETGALKIRIVDDKTAAELEKGINESVDQGMSEGGRESSKDQDPSSSE